MPLGVLGGDPNVSCAVVDILGHPAWLKTLKCGFHQMCVQNWASQEHARVVGLD